MGLYAGIAVGAVALLHLYIAWFEMFAWETKGPKVFKILDPDLFPRTKVLAFNQGLYNAFLAAGLIWALWIGDPVWSAAVATFFLLCVAVAGVVGWVTAKSLLVLGAQTGLAGVALVVVWGGRAAA